MTPPNDADALAIALTEALVAGEHALDAGRHADAAEAFARACALAPSDVGLALALANAHQLAGAADARLVVLRTAFERGAWRDAGVAHALGGALLEAGEVDAAVACFTHVLAQRPTDPAALAALASALRTAGDPTAAWPHAKRAAELAPRTGAVLLTAAQVRHDVGDLLGALGWLDKADRARPDHAPTRLQRAYTSLLRGPSAAGWALFEHRPLPAPDTGAAPWQGEPLAGRSVLVTAEQGVGDQFQFLRFVPELVARGAGRVIVACHPAAVTLLAASGIDAVPRGAPPVTDLHVPLLSLPHRLGTGASLAGDRVPYLRAPDGPTPPLPDAPAGQRRLGLVWSGNPAFTGRATRDLPASLLPALLAIPGVTWVSLQQGAAGDVALPGLHRLPPLADWAETARVLDRLDGLVTTDTGIAHLAGAMGRPAWVLLQKVPDWRWGLTGERTPWYPSLTLVRQRAWRDWRGVIERLRALLAPKG